MLSENNTVNSETFARVLFSRIGEITLLLTDISKSRPCHEFLMSQICVLMLFVKIKISRKFTNLQYFEGKPSSKS